MKHFNTQEKPMPNRKIPIAILGATGAVGQRMIQLLAGHPWFEIAALTGSDRTVGRPYGELVRWVLDGAPPPDVARMVVQPSDTPLDVPLIIPEVNPDHLEMLDRQRAERGWKGCLITNPNCAVIGIVMALKPLHD